MTTMDKNTFEQHDFRIGEKVLYKGEPAKVISVHTSRSGWHYLMIAYGPEGRGRNFAACGHEDIELIPGKK